MKLKKIIGKISAFVLAGTLMLGNVPVYADTAANSGADVFATQGSDFTIRIPKQLVLSGNEGTGAYRIAVKGNISGTDVITVTPDSEFYMKQEGKSDILATITQPKTDFTYADGIRPDAEVTSDGVIEMASISAGKWSGIFNFTVTSSVDLGLEDSIGSDKADISTTPTVGNDVSQNKHSEYDVITSKNRTPIRVVAIDNIGTDLNANASAIIGKDAASLLLELNKSGLIEEEQKISALIEVESDGFEGLAETTFYVSSIAKPGDVVTVVHFNDKTQEWEHIVTDTVSEDGTITGFFENYSPVAFIKDKDGNTIPHYHNLEEFVQDPTCTEDGIITYTCKDYCGYISLDFIDALGHDYKITNTTESTCTEEGYTTYTCERCGDSYTDDKVPALGHSYGDWEIIEEATCINAGSKKKTCSVCNDVIIENADVSGHAYSDWVTIKEANCTEAGSKQKTCSACGDVVTESIDALGHDYETQITNPTCTKDGFTTYECHKCNDTYTGNIVPAIGHTYGNWVTTKEQDCTVNGSKQKTCSTCGNVVTENIEALGHNWNSNFTIDKEATCTTPGSKSIHCSECNTTKDITSIPATGHISVNGGTSAVHTKCSVCGTTLSSSHSYTNKVTKEATCTTTGIRTYTCGCGYSYIENIPATGHTYGNWENTKEPTCTEIGSKKKTCSICGNVVTEDISALGHNWNTNYTIDKKETCTTAGSKSIHCSKCNTTKDVTTIPATGHTSVNGGTASVHTKCSVCGTTLSSTHSYTSKVTKEATCTTAGTKLHSCSCGYSYTETITASHSVVGTVCTKCNQTIGGLYDANGTLLVTWEDSGIGDNCHPAAKIINTNYPTTTKVVIPEGITNMTNSAFSETNITSIYIPKSLTSILTVVQTTPHIAGSSPFRACNNLTTIVVHPDNPVYDSRNNCNAIIEKATNTLIIGCKSTVIPNSIKAIGHYAFFENDSITSVTIPEGVTSIGSYAFYECSNLTNITIPASLTKIGDNAFFWCSKLASATFANPYNWYHHNRYSPTELQSINTNFDLTDKAVAARCLRYVFTECWVRK